MATNTYILIHGALHGSWCFDELKKILQAKGHEVYAPTLTGLAERKHLLTEHLTAQVHIDDIINLIRFKNLTNIILVGHSYAGILLPAVNEVLAKKIQALVFLDAFVPENGRTVQSVVPEERWNGWQLLTQSYGNGWRIIPTEKHIESWGITDPKEKEYVKKHITDFSSKFVNTPIYFSEKFNNAKKHYIRCTKPSVIADVLLPFYENALANNWQTSTLDTHHDPMIADPEGLAEILLANNV